MPGALDRIMDTYKSSTKKEAFRAKGLLIDRTQLINSQDFNFRGVLTHAAINKNKLAIEYCFDLINKQPTSVYNYDLIMMNLEAIIDNGHGMYLDTFMDDAHDGTTFSIKVDDPSLELMQCSTAFDYCIINHDDEKECSGALHRFQDLVK